MFRELHERDGAFVMPNPWDIGSARLMTSLGFEALATTSYGFAYTLGRSDGSVSVDEVIGHCREICTATVLPVNADLENCFSDNPEEAAKTIFLAAEAGIVGGSIEDYTGDDSKPIYDFTLAVERVQAAVEASRSLDIPFTLTARAENMFRAINDLDDTIRRLQAYETAGADVLYAPGLKTVDEVKNVVGALKKPVNVLAPPIPGVTVGQLEEAGVKRISIGGALTKSVITLIVKAGREMLNNKSFDWTTEVIPNSEIIKLLTVE